MRTVDHTNTLIKVEKVSFAYAPGACVLCDVDLSVHRGDYLGIIGPNGGGKTTLLKLMLGLLVPQSGSISLFGIDARSFKERYRIGYVPQRFQAFDSNFPATVEEVVVMGRYARRGLLRPATAKDREAAQEALKKVDMSDYRRHLIGDLSGGQLQRVFIARALAAEPEVLLLDEPTANVDRATEEEFYRLLKSLNEDWDLTLVLVSHDLERVAKEATEIALVDQTLTYYSNPSDARYLHTNSSHHHV